MTEVESGAPRPDATTVTVGVPAESAADERRVALVPKAVAGLTKSGVSVVVQSGAGDAALLPDDLYTEAGATIGDPWAADIVVKVAEIDTADFSTQGPGNGVRLDLCVTHVLQRSNCPGDRLAKCLF